MKKYANVLSVAILAGLAVGASAQGRPVQRMTEGREVQVLAYAPIDAEGRIIGAWQQSSVFDFSPNYIAFDNYEAAPGGTGAPDEFRLPNFGEGNNRYWFGDGYKSCFVINDFTVVSGYAAGAAKRANFAFAQTAAGAEAVFVQIRTYETFTGINSPPGATGFLSIPDSFSSRIHACALCDTVTPLGLPPAPEVYKQKAMSSAVG